MIKNLFKLFLLGKFYFWLKPRLIGLAILFAAIALILYTHSEYISWVEISDRKIFLGYSYVLKNVLIVIAIIIYFIFAIRKKKKSPKATKLFGGKHGDLNMEEDLDWSGRVEEKNDGFDALRKKEKLKTEYERILEGTDEKDEDENKK